MVGETYSRKPNKMHDDHSRYKYYRSHLVQYILVIVVFVFSISILFQLESVFLRLIVIIFNSVFYLIFGIWHHIEEKNLTSKHTIEYLVVSAIVFVILYSIFL